MKPIAFRCSATLKMASREIAAQILDTSNWAEFPGYGPIPGIESAEFELRTAEIVGSRVRVRNTDGSSHVEEIVAWQPGRRLQLEMNEFSPPLSWLATAIVETWEFEEVDRCTEIVRTFELYAKRLWTWPFIWVASIFLRRAVVRHLGWMAAQSEPEA